MLIFWVGLIVATLLPAPTYQTNSIEVNAVDGVSDDGSTNQGSVGSIFLDENGAVQLQRFSSTPSYYRWSASGESSQSAAIKHKATIHRKVNIESATLYRYKNKNHLDSENQPIVHEVLVKHPPVSETYEIHTDSDSIGDVIAILDQNPTLNFSNIPNNLVVPNPIVDSSSTAATSGYRIVTPADTYRLPNSPYIKVINPNPIWYHKFGSGISSWDNLPKRVNPHYFYTTAPNVLVQQTPWSYDNTLLAHYQKAQGHYDGDGCVFEQTNQIPGEYQNAGWYYQTPASTKLLGNSILGAYQKAAPQIQQQVTPEKISVSTPELLNPTWGVLPKRARPGFNPNNVQKVQNPPLRAQTPASTQLLGETIWCTYQNAPITCQTPTKMPGSTPDLLLSPSPTWNNNNSLPKKVLPNSNIDYTKSDSFKYITPAATKLLGSPDLHRNQNQNTPDVDNYHNLQNSVSSPELLVPNWADNVPKNAQHSFETNQFVKISNEQQHNNQQNQNQVAIDSLKLAVSTPDLLVPNWNGNIPKTARLPVSNIKTNSFDSNEQQSQKNASSQNSFDVKKGYSAPDSFATSWDNLPKRARPQFHAQNFHVTGANKNYLVNPFVSQSFGYIQTPASTKLLGDTNLAYQTSTYNKVSTNIPNTSNAAPSTILPSSNNYIQTPWSTKLLSGTYLVYQKASSNAPVVHSNVHSNTASNTIPTEYVSQILQTPASTRLLGGAATKFGSAQNAVAQPQRYVYAQNVAANLLTPNWDNLPKRVRPQFHAINIGDAQNLVESSENHMQTPASTQLLGGSFVTSPQKSPTVQIAPQNPVRYSQNVVGIFGSSWDNLPKRVQSQFHTNKVGDAQNSAQSSQNVVGSFVTSWDNLPKRVQSQFHTNNVGDAQNRLVSSKNYAQTPASTQLLGRDNQWSGISPKNALRGFDTLYTTNGNAQHQSNSIGQKVLTPASTQKLDSPNQNFKSQLQYQNKESSQEAHAQASSQQIQHGVDTQEPLISWGYLPEQVNPILLKITNRFGTNDDFQMPASAHSIEGGVHNGVQLLENDLLLDSLPKRVRPDFHKNYPTNAVVSGNQIESGSVQSGSIGQIQTPASTKLINGEHQTFHGDNTKVLQPVSTNIMSSSGIVTPSGTRLLSDQNSNQLVSSNRDNSHLQVQSITQQNRDSTVHLETPASNQFLVQTSPVPKTTHSTQSQSFSSNSKPSTPNSFQQTPSGAVLLSDQIDQVTNTRGKKLVYNWHNLPKNAQSHLNLNLQHTSTAGNTVGVNFGASDAPPSYFVPHQPENLPKRVATNFENTNFVQTKSGSDLAIKNVGHNGVLQPNFVVHSHENLPKRVHANFGSTNKVHESNVNQNFANESQTESNFHGEAPASTQLLGSDQTRTQKTNDNFHSTNSAHIGDSNLIQLKSGGSYNETPASTKHLGSEYHAQNNRNEHNYVDLGKNEPYQNSAKSLVTPSSTILLSNGQNRDFLDQKMPDSHLALPLWVNLPKRYNPHFDTPTVDLPNPYNRNYQLAPSQITPGATQVLVDHQTVPNSKVYHQQNFIPNPNDGQTLNTQILGDHHEFVPTIPNQVVFHNENSAFAQALPNSHMLHESLVPNLPKRLRPFYHHQTHQVSNQNRHQFNDNGADELASYVSSPASTRIIGSASYQTSPKIQLPAQISLQPNGQDFSNYAQTPGATKILVDSSMPSHEVVPNYEDAYQNIVQPQQMQNQLVSSQMTSGGTQILVDHQTVPNYEAYQNQPAQIQMQTPLQEHDAVSQSNFNGVMDGNVQTTPSSTHVFEHAMIPNYQEVPNIEVLPHEGYQNQVASHENHNFNTETPSGASVLLQHDDKFGTHFDIAPVMVVPNAYHSVEGLHENHLHETKGTIEMMPSSTQLLHDGYNKHQNEHISPYQMAIPNHDLVPEGHVAAMGDVLGGDINTPGATQLLMGRPNAQHYQMVAASVPNEEMVVSSAADVPASTHTLMPLPINQIEMAPGSTQLLHDGHHNQDEHISQTVPYQMAVPNHDLVHKGHVAAMGNSFSGDLNTPTATQLLISEPNAQHYQMVAAPVPNQEMIPMKQKQQLNDDDVQVDYNSGAWADFGKRINKVAVPNNAYQIDVGMNPLPRRRPYLKVVKIKPVMHDMRPMPNVVAMPPPTMSVPNGAYHLSEDQSSNLGGAPLPRRRHRVKVVKIRPVNVPNATGMDDNDKTPIPIGNTPPIVSNRFSEDHNISESQNLASTRLNAKSDNNVVAPAGTLPYNGILSSSFEKVPAVRVSPFKLDERSAVDDGAIVATVKEESKEASSVPNEESVLNDEPAVDTAKLVQENAKSDGVVQEKIDLKRHAQENVDLEKHVQEKSDLDKLVQENVDLDKLVQENAKSGELVQEKIDLKRQVQENVDLEKHVQEKSDLGKTVQEIAGLDKLVQENVDLEERTEESPVGKGEAKPSDV